MCDLVGATQTVAAHEAARKFLRLDSESDLGVNERYFWAQLFGSCPQHKVVNSEALTVVNMVIRTNEIG